MDKVMYFIKYIDWCYKYYTYELSYSGKNDYTINLFIKYEYQLISDPFPLNKHDTVDVCCSIYIIIVF